jgi:hypothetical protein
MSAGDEDLELIPRSVRDKLDRVGIKLHLSDWQSLTLAERRRLCNLPCEGPAQVAAYAEQVDALVRAHSGRAPDRLDER